MCHLRCALKLRQLNDRLLTDNSSCCVPRGPTIVKATRSEGGREHAGMSAEQYQVYIYLSQHQDQSIVDAATVLFCGSSSRPAHQHPVPVSVLVLHPREIPSISCAVTSCETEKIHRMPNVPGTGYGSRTYMHTSRKRPRQMRSG